MPVQTAVLVVDDDDSVRGLVRTCLKRFGFHDVEVAVDGSAALEKMRTRSYGLVICDWHMNRMSGYELLQSVRADPNLCKVPFIMLTGEARRDLISAIRNIGATAYLMKPFVPQTLKMKIDSVLSGQAS